MNKPEWKKELEKETSDREAEIRNAINTHNVENKHRAIYISTNSPTNTEGNNGDIWFVIAE